MKSSLKKLRVGIVFLFFMAVILGLSACVSGSGQESIPAPGTSQTAPATNTSSLPPPGLSVAAIELLQVEGQPIMAGKQMVLNVYIKDTGSAPSGPYHVLIFIKDVIRGSTYPYGKLPYTSMNPGEQKLIFSQTTSVNCPGKYEVHVEITLDTQGNTTPQNNTKMQAFTAVGDPC